MSRQDCSHCGPSRVDQILSKLAGSIGSSQHAATRSSAEPVEPEGGPAVLDAVDRRGAVGEDADVVAIAHEQLAGVHAEAAVGDRAPAREVVDHRVQAAVLAGDGVAARDDPHDVVGEHVVQGLARAAGVERRLRLVQAREGPLGLRAGHGACRWASLSGLTTMRTAVTSPSATSRVRTATALPSASRASAAGNAVDEHRVQRDGDDAAVGAGDADHEARDVLAAVDHAPRGLGLAAAVGVGVDVLGQQLDEALGVAVLGRLEEALGQLLVRLAIDLEARALGVDVAPRAG